MWRGSCAKACHSSRSRQNLKFKRWKWKFTCKIGFDIAKNGPSKFWFAYLLPILPPPSLKWAAMKMFCLWAAAKLARLKSLWKFGTNLKGLLTSWHITLFAFKRGLHSFDLGEHSEASVKDVRFYPLLSSPPENRIHRCSCSRTMQLIHVADQLLNLIETLRNVDTTKLSRGVARVDRSIWIPSETCARSTSCL